jgi:hypothetical protein
MRQIEGNQGNEGRGGQGALHIDLDFNIMVSDGSRLPRGSRLGV